MFCCWNNFNRIAIKSYRASLKLRVWSERPRPRHSVAAITIYESYQSPRFLYTPRCSHLIITLWLHCIVVWWWAHIIVVWWCAHSWLPHTCCNFLRIFDFKGWQRQLGSKNTMVDSEVSLELILFALPEILGLVLAWRWIPPLPIFNGIPTK